MKFCVQRGVGVSLNKQRQHNLEAVQEYLYNALSLFFVH